MESAHLKLDEVYPEQYLQNGFIGPDGELLDGLSGYYSLAMAYRLRSEGVTAKQVQILADRLTDLISTALAESEKLEDQPLDVFTKSELEKIVNSLDYRSCRTLSDLIDAARPRIIDWRTFAGFIIHVERIASQMSLLTI